MKVEDDSRTRRELLQAAVLVAGMGALMTGLRAEEAPGGGPPVKTPQSLPSVLITGANRGIGLEFARRYAERGYRVLATCRNPSTATGLQVLSAQHPGLRVEPLDLLDHAGIDKLSRSYAGFTIDILLNNAGIGGGNENQIFTKLNYATFSEVTAVNTLGPLKVCEAFLPQVLASTQKKMITVSSSQGSIGLVDAPRLYWYRSSKSAVNMLMANLALQLKGRGITVGLVTPGATDTDFMKGLPKRMLRPVADAVSDMLREIDRFDLARTGQFVDTNGATLPW